MVVSVHTLDYAIFFSDASVKIRAKMYMKQALYHTGANISSQIGSLSHIIFSIEWNTPTENTIFLLFGNTDSKIHNWFNDRENKLLF